MRELAQLGINPVTIPDEWGIDHLPNLLGAYFDKVNNSVPLTEEERHLLSRYNHADLVESLSVEELVKMSREMKRKKH